jgi:hypothetical protein
LSERGLESVTQFKIVFDEQEAHGMASRCKVRASYFMYSAPWKDKTINRPFAIHKYASAISISAPAETNRARGIIQSFSLR